MATSTSQALRQVELARATEPAVSSDLDGASCASSGSNLRGDPEARCVLCMAEHLLAAANVPGADAAREAARRLEAECPACLARPGGGR